MGEVNEDELYAALDWLHERQPAIETAVAKRHLRNGTPARYDVSSSYLEGRCCPLAKRSCRCDGRKGTLQITYGLLCRRWLPGRGRGVRAAATPIHGEPRTPAPRRCARSDAAAMAGAVIVSKKGYAECRPHGRARGLEDGETCCIEDDSRIE
ncbi:MAG: hypothetical protein ACREFO_06820 [Acetobacteraceae bacterium]